MGLAEGGAAIHTPRIFYERFSTRNKQGCVEMIPPPVARRAGDVIVYHHRMFHAATQNFSGRIRMAPPEGSPVPTS